MFFFLKYNNLPLALDLVTQIMQADSNKEKIMGQLYDQLGRFDLKHLEALLQTNNSIVTSNPLLTAQVNQHLRQQSGVQAQPKFLNPAQAVTAIIRNFFTAINNQDLLIIELSPSIKRIIQQLYPKKSPYLLQSEKGYDFNIYLSDQELEITSISNYSLLWLIIKFLQQQDQTFIVDILTNSQIASAQATYAKLENNSLSQEITTLQTTLAENLVSEEEKEAKNLQVQSEVYFLAKRLHAFSSKLYQEHPEFVLDLITLDLPALSIKEQCATAKMQEFMEMHFIPEMVAKQELRELIALMRQIYLATSAQNIAQQESLLKKQASNSPRINANKILHLTQLDALTLIAESEFKVNPAREQILKSRPNQRLFYLDIKLYNPRDLAILKKAAQLLNLDIMYFVNTVTPHLFSTMSRKSFLTNFYKYTQEQHTYSQQLQAKINTNFTFYNKFANKNLLSYLGVVLRHFLAGSLSYEAIGSDSQLHAFEKPLAREDLRLLPTNNSYRALSKAVDSASSPRKSSLIYRFSGQQFLYEYPELEANDSYAEFDIFLTPYSETNPDSQYYVQSTLFSQLQNSWVDLFTESKTLIEQQGWHLPLNNQQLAQILLTPQVQPLLSSLVQTAQKYPTLLEQIKKSLLEYTEFAASEDAAYRNNQGQQPSGFVHYRGDDSFVLVKAHSRRREIEFAHDFILKEIAAAKQRGEKLSLHDFIIIAPHISEYSSLIKQFYAKLAKPESDEYEFYTNLQQQPDKLTYVPSYVIQEEQLVANEIQELFQALFALESNELTQETLEFWLAQEPISKFYGIDATDRESFNNILKNHPSNAALGYDHDPLNIKSRQSNHPLPLQNQYQKAQTTYDENALQDIPLLNYNSWQHILLRANLNASFAYGDQDQVFFTNELPYLQSAQQYAALSKFSLLITDLNIYAQFINQRHNHQDWINFCQNLRIKYLSSFEFSDGQCFEILRHLAAQAFAAQSNDKIIDKAVFKDLLTSAFNRVKTSYQVENKLVFTSLVNITSCSYKYTICLGLNFGDFPLQENKNTLDFTDSLLLKSNKPSFYQFSQQNILDLLTNTQRKLVFSYIGKDAKDTDINASMLIDDIVKFVRNNLMLPTSLVKQEQTSPNDLTLIEQLMGLVYSTKEQASFIQELTLSSFAPENYGLASYQLKNKLEQAYPEQATFLSPLLEQQASSSFIRSWYDSLTTQSATTTQPNALGQAKVISQEDEASLTSFTPIEANKAPSQATNSSLVQLQENLALARKENFGNLKEILDDYLQIMRLSQEFKLVYQQQIPKDAQILTTITAKNLKDFSFTTNTNFKFPKELDERISKLQKIKSWEQKLYTANTYGLPHNKVSFNWFIAPLVKELQVGKNPEQILTSVLLNGKSLAQSIFEDKNQYTILRSLQEYYRYISGDEKIVQLESVLASNENDGHLTYQPYPATTSLEETTQYLYFQLPAAFCHAYLNLLEKLPLLQSNQNLYRMLESIRVVKNSEYDIQANDWQKVYVRIEVDLTKRLLVNKDEQSQDTFYEERQIAAQESSIIPNANPWQILEQTFSEKNVKEESLSFSNPFNLLLQQLAASKDPNYRGIFNLIYQPATITEKEQEYSSISTTHTIFYHEKPQVTNTEDLVALQTFLAQLVMWYILGENLLLPFTAESEKQNIDGSLENPNTALLVKIFRQRYALDKEATNSYLKNELTKFFQAFNGEILAFNLSTKKTPEITDPQVLATALAAEQWETIYFHLFARFCTIPITSKSKTTKRKTTTKAHASETAVSSTKELSAQDHTVSPVGFLQNSTAQQTSLEPSLILELQAIAALNITSAVNSSVTEELATEVEEIVTTPVKKRGRPRKVISEQTGEITNSDIVAANVENEMSVTINGMEVTPKVETTPVKAKRGRPRKN